MTVTLEIKPVHLPRSLKLLNRACGAFRANTKKCSISPRCGSLSASYRDQCSGWILIGAFITCAAMHTMARMEQTQPNKCTPTERPAVPRHIRKAQPANLPHRQCLPLPVSPSRSDAVFSTVCTGFSGFGGFFVPGDVECTVFQAFSCCGLLLAKRLAPVAHPLPPAQSCNLHHRLAALGSLLLQHSLTVSKARRHLWLFPKSVMMEGSEEVWPPLWQAAPACRGVSQAGEHHTQGNWVAGCETHSFYQFAFNSQVWAAQEVGSGLGCSGVA